jgi:NosR/NirI family transcriptional regulator, nitrous oxide reductase regulator
MTLAARSLLVVLGCIVMMAPALNAGAGKEAGAGSKKQDPPYTVVALAAQQASPGQFDFPEEEDDQPTWQDEVRAQAVDIGLVVAFSALAFISFFRKSRTLKYVTLVASVVYVGFWKSTLLSIVNVFGLFGGNLPIFRYSIAWYLLVAITVVSTILWGRVYCGRICAFGALTQLMDLVLPAKWRIKVPRAIEDRAAWIKYGILASVLVYFIVTRNPLIYPYVEPFWLFGIHGKTPLLWAMLTTLLIATVFVRNLYCRFLCPLGAFLGILSTLTVFRIKRWSECKTCKICEKACEWGAIRGPKIVLTECVRCDDCERLYEDTKKCPHHLILIRKADILARRAASPTPAS